MLEILLIIAFINYTLYFINKKTPKVLYCGIIGFIGNYNYDPNKIKILLHLNNFERGGDGIGLYTNSLDFYKNPVVKTVQSKTDYINGEFSSELESRASNVLISHVRKNSIGGISTENVHPFKYSNIVGCHNGTITNWAQLRSESALSVTEFNTDSKVLLKLISEHLNFPTYSEFPEVLKTYKGSAALLYFDEQTELMYAYRDSERPLYYGVIEEGVYFSSLKYPLELIGCTFIEELPEFELLVFDSLSLVKSYSYTKQQYKILSTSLPSTHSNLGNEDYTGIELNYHTKDYLKGMNVYLDFEKEGDTLKRWGFEDIPYLVEDSNYSSLTITSSSGSKMSLDKRFFKLGNCLPVIGGYVELLSNFVSKNTGVQLAKAGERYLVDYYNILTGACTIEVDSNVNIRVNSQNLVASNAEKFEEIVEEEYNFLYEEIIK